MTLYLTEAEYRYLWPDPDPLYVPGDELAYSTPRHIPWRWLALALVLLIAWRKLL